MKPFKKLIILLIILLSLLCVYIFKIQYDKKKEASINTDDSSIQLIKIDKENINNINIKNSKGNLSIQNKNDKWIVGSGNYKIDTFSVDSIVSGLSDIQALRIISENNDNMSKFGLDNPTAEATILLNDKTTKKILLGDMVPGGSSYYAMVDKDPKIYTISSYTGNLLLKTLDDLRDKSLTLIPDDNNVTQVKVINQNNSILLKSLDNSWYIEEPYGKSVSASYDKMYSKLQSMKTVNIETFVEDNCKDFSKYGLDKPSSQVIVSCGNEKYGLLFGYKSDSGSVYFKTLDGDSVYTMSQSSYDIFNIDAYDLVNSCPVNPYSSDIDEMIIQSDKNKYDIKITRQKQSSKNNDEDKKSSDTSKNNSNSSDSVITTYTLNGKSIKEQDFNTIFTKYYTIVIDSEIKKQVEGKFEPEVTITFKLNKGLEKNVTIEFVPYNDQFYEMIINGKCNFVISKSQIDEILKAAESISSK